MIDFNKICKIIFDFNENVVRLYEGNDFYAISLNLLDKELSNAINCKLKFVKDVKLYNNGYLIKYFF